ncbi:Protein RnfH [Rhodospirillaceae bacterium LM-1]|jgi:putative ubiquitin-RnfH superfamily antitoxin RatB of RatAB toxin-antitoxin module|nr:Protein RnfH [Rhodospirillaceae bacterium LM-1]
MKVGVAYATPAKQVWLTVDMPEGACVKDAIEKSGILKQFPEIDLNTQKVGIYGKASTLEAVLEEGARVEIYRPMTADPKTVPRRAKAGGEAASEG